MFERTKLSWGSGPQACHLAVHAGALRYSANTRTSALRKIYMKLVSHSFRMPDLSDGKIARFCPRGACNVVQPRRNLRSGLFEI